MKYVMLTVIVIILVIVAPIMALRLLAEAADASAQAETARGQAAALIVQAQAQGDLLRAQALITEQAALAVAADRRAAHGASAAQVAAMSISGCAVVVLVAGLALELRRTRAQVAQLQAQE
jgi:biopolymer transport protein ExbD